MYEDLSLHNMMGAHSDSNSNVEDQHLNSSTMKLCEVCLT